MTTQSSNREKITDTQRGEVRETPTNVVLALIEARLPSGTLRVTYSRSSCNQIVRNPSNSSQFIIISIPLSDRHDVYTALARY